MIQTRVFDCRSVHCYYEQYFSLSQIEMLPIKVQATLQLKTYYGQIYIAIYLSLRQTLIMA